VRYSGRGSWFAFAVALALFAVSDQIANAADADIVITGGVKEQQKKDKKKAPKPIPVVVGAKGICTCLK